MKKLKIGITIGLKSNTESIWTNGIKLNILILLKLLKKSQKNYDVCLLNTLKVDFTDKPDYLKDIDIHYIEDKYKEIDLMIVMGSQVNGKILQDFKKKKNKKIVSYKCGNNYILDMEDILFKESIPVLANMKQNLMKYGIFLNNMKPIKVIIIHYIEQIHLLFHFYGTKIIFYQH